MTAMQLSTLQLLEFRGPAAYISLRLGVKHQEMSDSKTFFGLMRPETRNCAPRVADGK